MPDPSDDFVTITILRTTAQDLADGLHHAAPLPPDSFSRLGTISIELGRLSNFIDDLQREIAHLRELCLEDRDTPLASATIDELTTALAGKGVT